VLPRSSTPGPYAYSGRGGGVPHPDVPARSATPAPSSGKKFWFFGSRK
jgi:hypothetical protein